MRERQGFTDVELRRYRMDPSVEPPRLLASAGTTWGGAKDFKRGDVRKVDDDIQRSKL